MLNPVGVVDCDLHNEVPGVEALIPYLPEFWVESIENTEFKGPVDQYYPPLIWLPEEHHPVAAFHQAVQTTDIGDSVRSTQSSLERLRQRSLGPDPEARGILNCTYAVDSLHNPEQAVAIARAVNDWQASEWLDREPRLRASIVVPSHLPQLAAEEIDRVASDSRFVQVLLPARSHHPYGNRLYLPLWEAIAAHDLVAGIHFGGAPTSPPTAVGWPSYYLEEYAGMSLVFAAQLTSLIMEGVLDRFSNLRVTLLESGFTWLPPHMWRMDKEWRQLRRLVPWIKRLPSLYVREHFRVTIQPLDGPAEPAHLVELIEQLGSDQLLLYASDYPHRHTRDPNSDLLDHLPAELSRKISGANARSWYRLES